MHVQGVSGKPPPAADCPACRTPNRGLDLQAVGYHPRLNGSKRLKSPTLGRLRTCRQCGRLWSENFDQREGYRWFADLGLHGVDILHQQATPIGLVNHAARETTERGLGWMPLAAEAWMKRDKQWAPAVFDAVLASLALPVDQPNETAAQRRLGLVRLAVVAVTSMGHDRRILHPPTPSAIRAACAGHIAASGSGLAYLGKNRSIMYSLACAQTIAPPVGSSQAQVQANGLEPIIEAALGGPIPGEASGYQRGLRRHLGFQYLSKLRDRAGRWCGSDAILAMPEMAWQRLDQALDPVLLANRIIEQLLAAIDSGGERRRDLLLETETLFCELVQQGARVSDRPTDALRNLLAQMKASLAQADLVACQPLEKMLRSALRAAHSDCSATTGECAG